MMSRSPFGWIIAAVFLAGCFTPPPRSSTSLSAISPTNSALRRMRVAVIYDDNARSAVAYLRGVREKTSSFGPTFDDQAAIRPFNDLLRKSFSEVAVIESPEQAAATGANTIGIVSLYAKVGTVPFTMSETDLSVDFRRLDMSEISVVRGAGRRRVPYPNFGPNWPASAQDAVDTFGAALSTDTALSAYAAALAAPAPSVSVAAPVPPREPALPASPAPGFSAPERLNDLAVIVGIESYSDIASKAPYAERDADAFRAHVRALGVPERNIVLLKGSKAGRASLEKNIESWLPRLAKPDSRVYFYFSGHGAPDVKTGQAYLVPWDGDPNFLDNTAYPVAKLYKKLGELPAKQVLVAMDSCFSGAGGRSVLASGARPLVGKIDTGALPAKITVLAASASNEISGSLDEKGHGAFTYFLLQGLGAGKRTPKALSDYLTPLVQDEARRLNRDQTPQLQGDGSWSLR